MKKLLILLLQPLFAFGQNENLVLHKDYLEYEQTFKPIFAQLEALDSQIAQVPEDKKEAVLLKYISTLAKFDKEAERFIISHPSSPVSLHLLAENMKFYEGIENAERLFDLLTGEVRNSAKGKELGDYFLYAKAGHIGTVAPDFTQYDVDGKPVSLSDFKGKYVLLDFWASYCKPCRQENPNLVKAYHQFKNRNFTVLGVSLDTKVNNEKWLEAIKKDGLPWTNVSDLKGWNSVVVKLYKLEELNQNFLLDPTGKIIAKNIKGAELQETLCKVLGCSN